MAEAAEAEDGQLQIMYGIGGESRLEEQELEHLSGYERGAAGADRQRRLPPAPARRVGRGARLDLSAHRSRDQLPDRLWPIIKRQVEGALEHWREPDHGIWEVRGEPKHFTSSKLMCWVAADRGARLALLRDDREWADALARRRPMRSTPTSARTGSIERGVFVQHYDSDRARRLAAADAAGALPARR